jgi:ABC-type polysaccharide/polyol phosphate export permease
VLITPVMLLAIYAVRLRRIARRALRQSRVGGDVIAFLALGMWPWHAFADSLARGTSALTGNAALIGQIAIPRVWLVLVPTLGCMRSFTPPRFLLVLLIAADDGRRCSWASAHWSPCWPTV